MGKDLTVQGSKNPLTVLLKSKNITSSLILKKSNELLNNPITYDIIGFCKELENCIYGVVYDIVLGLSKSKLENEIEYFEAIKQTIRRKNSADSTSNAYYAGATSEKSESAILTIAKDICNCELAEVCGISDNKNCISYISNGKKDALLKKMSQNYILPKGMSCNAINLLLPMNILSIVDNMAYVALLEIISDEFKALWDFCDHNFKKDGSITTLLSSTQNKSAIQIIDACNSWRENEKNEELLYKFPIPSYFSKRINSGFTLIYSNSSTLYNLLIV